MKKFFIIPLLMVAAAACGGNPAPSKVAITAHRGFWKSEAGEFSQNSIASLKAAQDEAFWGSEADVHLTTDGVMVINHDDVVDGVRIDANPFAALSEVRLKNGESLPTFEEFLAQGAQSDRTVLVVELKPHPDRWQEDSLVDKAIRALQAHGLFTPERVIFISFSINICRQLVDKAPGFTNQYLNGELSPDELHYLGINGLDYEFTVFYEHPEWIEQAHRLGMSTNAWTVNRREDMERLIDLGIGCLTTNEPLLAREILGDRELKIDK